LLLQVNGNLTKAENIADFGGLPTAYRAYQAWKAAKGPDSKLIDHEHYSDEQLFFLGAASMWCERNTQQYLTLLLLNDAHSPGKFRVNGVLWGMPEFARAFNCPLGSAMNPNNANRCKVW
jgi:predicted metalloendopeptidase